MRYPKRAITRDIRTRAAKRRERAVTDIEALGWPERALRVKDLMSRAPLAVGLDTPVGRAWKQMQTRKIRHLPVLEGRRLAGIVSDRDLRQVILEPAIQEQLGNMSRALNILTVRDVMTWGVGGERAAGYRRPAGGADAPGAADQRPSGSRGRPARRHPDGHRYYPGLRGTPR